jgi:N-acetyl sugar amidotransferase
MDKKICALGIWDEDVPGISFDAGGVSNYARIQQKLMETYPKGEKGHEEWLSIVADAKKHAGTSYDCIIGVSGGVDSSYLLYLAKVKYGLNPLAVTLDNGWSTNIAVENIKKTTNALGVDLETYVIDYEEIKDLMRSYMLAGLPWIDSPTDTAIKAVMYKYALEEKVKYIFRGNDFRSEGKQPRAWTYSDSLIKETVHKRFGKIRKLKSYPDLPFWKIVYGGFIRGVKEVRPYYYLDYTKDEARAFLEKEYGWQYYGGHHHENGFTKYTMAVWLPDKFGIDKRKINLSAQVLSGTMSREAALEEIASPSLPDRDKTELTTYIAKKLDFSTEEFAQLLASPNKSYQDYPNYEKMLFLGLRFFKPLIKLVYKQMPMTFVEMEMNKKNG